VDIPLILVSIGIIAVIVSFFVGGSARKYSEDLEKVSMSLHQETSGLKKRLRAVEEELMIGIGNSRTSKPNHPTGKPVHEIIVNQILSLHAQGFSTDDIAKRSSITNKEVAAVLRSKGVI